MTCREVVEFLMAYLDGELPDDQRIVFERHLHECSECVEFMERYRLTLSIEKQCCCPEADAATQVPPGLVAAIMAGLKRELPNQHGAGKPLQIDGDRLV